MGKFKFYAVKRGRKPGVYDNWPAAKSQVEGYTSPVYRGFKDFQSADEWIKGKTVTSSRTAQIETKAKGNEIEIYTDGACKHNPGPGGYGIVIKHGGKEKTFSAGYKLTTNNRMELLACIVALETLKKKASVILYSDSSYVVNAINKSWVFKWEKNNWKRNRTDYAENIDLWKRFLSAYRKHQVKMVWVKGHAGNPGNERCDRLASAAAESSELLIDSGYPTAND